MNKNTISLVANTITNEDVDALRNWLGTYPRLTYGELTKQFEEKFAQYVGSKYAVFVNSGSSANLLATYTAKHLGKRKIGMSALCWSTDVFPAVQFGMDIHFLNWSDFNYGIHIDSIAGEPTSYYDEYAEERINQHLNIDCLLAIDVLGFPAFNNMFWLRNTCKDNNIYLIEDACESLGSIYDGKYAGTFGNIGTYSFYFGHHISTGGEGGMLVTDDLDTYEFLLSIRSHGWGREWSDDTRAKARKKFGVSEFDEKFTFYYPGFNVRPTEIQAFLGLRQLPKLEWIAQKRAWNFEFYKQRLNGQFQFPRRIREDRISAFGIPLIHPNREELIKKLTENNIESRPLIAGNFLKQPAIKWCNYTSDEINNEVNEKGLYLPCHQNMSRSDIDFICDIVLSV